MLVKTTRRIVFGMNQNGADADDIGGRNDAAQGVEQQAGAKAFTLRSPIDGEACEQKCRDWVTREAFFHPLRGLVIFDARGAQAIVTHNTPFEHCNICLGATRALI